MNVLPSVFPSWPHRSRCIFRQHLVAACVLMFLPGLAQANGYLPTMISANGMWLFALPVVVMLEGWLLKRWGWPRPYAASFRANALSMLVALPIGFVLSYLGWWISVNWLPKIELGLLHSLVLILAMVMFYGEVPAPDYGFVGYHTFPGIALAAFGFIGMCWIFTVLVEGWYLGKQNPKVGSKTLAGKMVLMHLISYSLLMSLWLPFTYFDASYSEKWLLRHCLNPGRVQLNCGPIWQKIPSAPKIAISSRTVSRSGATNRKRSEPPRIPLFIFPTR